MQFVEVILNLPVDQPFTYSFEPKKDSKSKVVENLPEIGKRAEIMFGNRKTTGFITGIYNELPPNCPVGLEKIRPLKRVLDEKPLFGKELIETARWTSRYYLCTFGEAVFAMIPSGRRESSAGGFSFESELLGSNEKNILSEEQEKAVQEIILSAENISEKSSTGLFHYLYGPTGSGKTEVFLSVAEKMLEKGKGVIYLVPEISLTSQVTQDIVNRFGNTAAIIHSGLTPSRKLNEWHRIQNQEARVVIGPRSAVFAPVPNLGLIIIDEEHDGSYKSGTTPRYHARQVAMHRAVTGHFPLIMGSATPSVEAWHGMQSGSILRHTLSVRLSGGAMPKIGVINLNNFKTEGCISAPLETEINRTLKNGKQTILFLNRRGFTHYFTCRTCGYEIKCKNCSVPLTYHKNDNRLKCHYCGWWIQPPQSCPHCGSLEIGSSGFGTEFIEAETKAKFPSAKILRLDTDVIASKKEELVEKLDEFRKGQYDILLGTQMVAKGLNFPKLQLVGVILADTGLHMPDFRAGERTFSLITQVAGRAGRYFPDGKVLVQTYNPGQEPISYAVASRTKEFYELELQNRQILDFPPFCRLIRLVFRSPVERLAFEACKDAAQILKQGAPKGVLVLGPAECPLNKISQNYRFQILMKGSSIIPLQAMARNLQQNYTHNPNVYIEYDIDPINLL
ncbi:MAG: primosomal protein N' [Treponema sp.]|nr:primosomal protein N' [Treponema sp.]